MFHLPRTESSSRVVVRSTGAYEKLSGHPAGPVPGWVAELSAQFWTITLPGWPVWIPISLPWLSTDLWKRCKIPPPGPPTWCSMLGGVKDTTQGLRYNLCADSHPWLGQWQIAKLHHCNHYTCEYFNCHRIILNCNLTCVSMWVRWETWQHPSDYLCSGPLGTLQSGWCCSYCAATYIRTKAIPWTSWSTPVASATFRSHQAVCCDECAIWYHKSCVSMLSREYKKIEDVSWNCIKCKSQASPTILMTSQCTTYSSPWHPYLANTLSSTHQHRFTREVTAVLSTQDNSQWWIPLHLPEPPQPTCTATNPCHWRRPTYVLQ